MKGLTLSADWSPKSGYPLTEWEKETRKVITASSVWRNPSLELKDCDVPKPGPKDVLLKIKACGVCGTDVHLFEHDTDGYVLYPGLIRFPAILGHEFSGEVVEVGKDVVDSEVGDAVTAEEMVWCGECIPCRNGFPNQCERLEEIGITINGAMAPYLAVPAKLCWRLNELRDHYTDESAVYDAGALVEPTSVAYNAVFERGQGFRPGAYAVVYGAGPIGLLGTALMRAAGAAKIVVFEMFERRRKLAQEMGADYVYDPAELEKQGVAPHQVVLDLTHGEGADFHLETAGVPKVTTPEMLKSLAVNARIVQTARSPETTPVYLETLQTRAAQIFGAQGHSGNGTFQNVIRLMASGRIDATKIITNRFSLDHGIEAFEEAKKRDGAKVLINP